MITPKTAAAYDTARSFETMTLQQLRSAWCSRYGKPHPPLRSTRLLAHLLAWRVQADVMGGLDRKTRTAVQVDKEIDTLHRRLPRPNLQRPLQVT